MVLKILDINSLRLDTGVIFNNQDPRFNAVLENHVSKIQKNLLENNRSNPYFRMFDNTIRCLANCCFFVQIHEKMYGLGIENCWIEIFENNDNYIHCGLIASFHLYSAVCGFYRISNIMIMESTSLKEEFEEDFIHICTYSENSYPFQTIFIENDTVEIIKWKKVYDQQELKKIIVKNHFLKTVNPKLYELEIAENNKVVFNIESDMVYLLPRHPFYVAYETELEDNKKIQFIDYCKNQVFLSITTQGLYRQLPFIDSLWFDNKIETISKNPLMSYSIEELYEFCNTLAAKAKKNDMYFPEKSPRNPNELFEFTFKNSFDYKGDIALSVAMKSNYFKKLSIEEYYTAFSKKDVESIELLFFILNENNYSFNDNIISYLNEVSLLKKIQNFLEVWKKFLSKAESTFFCDYIVNTKKHLLKSEYERLYNEKIINGGKKAYNRALAYGVHFGKWKSEQKMYSLIVRFYTDAIYQFHSEWLGLQSLDVYIPSLKIAFEYQGEQHYKASNFFGGEEGLNNNMERDARKKELCLKNNVTLIEWKYDEEINRDNFKKKLLPYISVMPTENLDYTWEDEKLKLEFNEKKKEVKTKSLKKVIVQYDIEGNYINHFYSQREASEKTGVSSGTISFVITGRQKTAGGFVWRYYYENEIPKKIEKTKISSSASIKILQLDLDGKIMDSFKSITSASKKCGIDRKNLRNALNGKQKTAGGYRWIMEE